MKKRNLKKAKASHLSFALGTMILVGGISNIDSDFLPTTHASEEEIVSNSEDICNLNGSSQVTNVDYVNGKYTQYLYVNTDRASLNNLLLFIEANVVDNSSVIIQDSTTTQVEIYTDPNHILVPGENIDYSQLEQNMTPAIIFRK